MMELVEHTDMRKVYREIKIRIRAAYYLLRKFNSPPNLVRDKGIYSTRLRVHLVEHEGEDR
jgi:hypothetical protein